MSWVNAMGAGMAWMWIFPVLFLTGLALFFGVFLRGMSGSPCGRPPDEERRRADSFSQETPKEILDRRYARGEITREQYLEMRKDLE